MNKEISDMPGDDPNKKKKARKDPMGEFQKAAQQFEDAAKHAGQVFEQVSAQARAQQAAPPQGGGKLSGAISSLNVNFPTTSAPPPAFAGVCVVHKFPEYVLIDFGSIDPLQTEEAPGGVMSAVLQHVGRIALPDSAARQLFARLAEHYGGAGG